MTSTRRVTGRNPLEIRASRQSELGVTSQRDWVVIPWKSGQVVRATRLTPPPSPYVVIPWKSGQVVRVILETADQRTGRNPLEIRASRQS